MAWQNGLAPVSLCGADASDRAQRRRGRCQPGGLRGRAARRGDAPRRSPAPRGDGRGNARHSHRRACLPRPTIRTRPGRSAIAHGSTQVRAAEAAARLAGADATRCARALFKLMAYKDEYEVCAPARGGSLLDVLRENFEGDYKINYHLSPPLRWRAKWTCRVGVRARSNSDPGSRRRCAGSPSSNACGEPR